MKKIKKIKKKLKNKGLDFFIFFNFLSSSGQASNLRFAVFFNFFNFLNSSDQASNLRFAVFLILLIILIKNKGNN